MQISSVKIEKFKRLTSLEIALGDITILIGGNNSGKSSLLQGLHLSITTLQSARAATPKAQPANTLGIDQFLYKPTSKPIKLYHKADMTSKNGPEFLFTYKATPSSELKNFSLTMRRGKNLNVAITFDHKDSFYERASDRTRPLSIFVPGLAGVALTEERRTDAIVTAGIAQGDANLYLRNVLLRLTLDEKKLEKFHSIIGEVFEGLRISCEFNERTNTHIEVMVEIDNNKIPLELVGAGALQAIQLVAYATMYEPALLLLDEPDAHLHPSNQRLLAATLTKIAEQGELKIILATHSRHVFDALTRSSMTEIVWLKNGEKQDLKDNEALSILLDLGALDSYELLTSNKCRVVVLTEDSKTDRLRFLLSANGFIDDEYVIQSYSGVSNMLAAATISNFFVKQGSDTHVLIHRDGDCMLPEEVSWFLEKESKNFSTRCTLFVTPLTDVEHQFCKPEHVAAVFGLPQAEADAIVDGLIAGNNGSLSVEFGNKRSDLKSKLLRDKKDVPSATDLISAQIKFDFVKGKRLLKLLNGELQKKGHNPIALVTKTSDALRIGTLRDFASVAWPKLPAAWLKARRAD